MSAVDISLHLTYRVPQKLTLRRQREAPYGNRSIGGETGTRPDERADLYAFDWVNYGDPLLISTTCNDCCYATNGTHRSMFCFMRLSLGCHLNISAGVFKISFRHHFLYQVQMHFALPHLDDKKCTLTHDQSHSSNQTYLLHAQFLQDMRVGGNSFGSTYVIFKGVDR